VADVIALIASLVVISGVIAYVGDLLGTYIGKKRLSLFGRRPKRTGQIIGIGAGVAIALVTLGVSALVFRGAVNTIFNARAVSQRLFELEVQEKNLQQQVQSLESQKTETENALAAANERTKTAEDQRLQAIQQRDDAQKEIEALNQQQKELEATTEKLRTDLKELETQLATASSDLGTANADLAEAKDELSTANERREVAVAEAEVAKAAAAQATTEVTTLRNQIDSVQKDLTAKTEELTEKTEALETASANLQTAQADVQVAEQDLAEARQDRDAALQARENAEAQMKTLEVTRDTLNDSLQTIQRQVDDYQQQAADLKVQNENLLVENTTLASANDSLKEENQDLTNGIAILDTQVESLKSQALTLNQQLEEQAKELEIVTEQMLSVSGGEVTYNINEAIHTGVITSQDPIQIRAELARLFIDANNKTAERGAGPIEPRTEQLETLVQAISESPGTDIVTLRSPYNQFRSAPVTVDVEAIENQLLVGRGQLVLSRQIHLGSDLPVTSEEVGNKVRELLRDANDKLLSLGLADNVATSTNSSSLSPEAFSNDLERFSGLVTIGLVASEEVYSSGPVELSLVILNSN
jgi:uncharacterized protein (DUF3084 family)